MVLVQHNLYIFHPWWWETNQCCIFVGCSTMEISSYCDWVGPFCLETCFKYLAINMWLSLVTFTDFTKQALIRVKLSNHERDHMMCEFWHDYCLALYRKISCSLVLKGLVCIDKRNESQSVDEEWSQKGSGSLGQKMSRYENDIWAERDLKKWAGQPVKIWGRVFLATALHLPFLRNSWKS